MSTTGSKGLIVNSYSWWRRWLINLV